MTSHPTYATLRKDALDWALRDDLDSAFPIFVRTAEAKIARMVRVREMETDATVGFVDQIGTLPSDFLGLVAVYLPDRKPFQDPLIFTPPDLIRSSREWNDEQDVFYPSLYSISGNRLLIAPAPGEQTVAIRYFARFPALTQDADTNWLLTNAYDIYLYAVLREINQYISDDEKALYWKNEYLEAVSDLHTSNSSSRMSGGPLISRGQARGVV